MTVIKWPIEPAFYKAIQQYAKEIVYGTLISMDPASGGTSSPGFALFYAGVLQVSGTLALPQGEPIQVRLAALYQEIAKITPAPPDVFVMERIRGQMAHQHLHWACGTSLAAARTKQVIEVPISAWHALRKSEGSTVKGDESDARYIGRTVIKLALEYLDGQHTVLFSTRKNPKGRTKGNPFSRRRTMGQE